MSKSSEGKPPKATRASTTKPAKKSDAPLSDAALAAAIKSVKAPASPPKSKAKVTPAKLEGPKAKNTPAKSTPSRKKAVHVPPSQDTIDKMIEEAAYFLAEKRHFAPGFEEQDWLEAKQQIMAQIEGAHRPLK